MARSEVRGSCHCGAVTLSVSHAPEWVGSCKCSLCTKLGWLVAYYPDDAVTVEGETVAYAWGDRMIGIHHCPVCGCGTHWKTLGEDFSKMGIHARMLDGFAVTGAGVCSIASVPVEVRVLDDAGD